MELQGLNFRPGFGVQEAIRSKFCCSVTPAASDRAFSWLLPSVAASSNSPASVGLVLRATIGGVASDFAVLPLSDRVFRFSVSLHLVGFHVLGLRSFECSFFEVFFHLWSNGGPHWVREWKANCLEEEASWTTVQRTAVDRGNNLIRHKTSFADVVRNNPLTGANRVPLHDRLARQSVFDRLIFPSAPDFSQNKGKKPIGQFLQTSPTLFNPGLNLNFGSSGGQLSSTEYPSVVQQPGICSRCLSEGHSREACKSPIRCFACKCGGHVALNY